MIKTLWHVAGKAWGSDFNALIIVFAAGRSKEKEITLNIPKMSSKVACSWSWKQREGKHQGHYTSSPDISLILHTVIFPDKHAVKHDQNS